MDDIPAHHLALLYHENSGRSLLYLYLTVLQGRVLSNEGRFADWDVLCGAVPCASEDGQDDGSDDAAGLYWWHICVSQIRPMAASISAVTAG